MTTHSTITVAAVLATLVLVLPSYARDHSALNGAWTLEPAKSDFAGQPVVQTGTVTISEHQGVTVVSRSFVYEGATESFFYNDSTGSENGGTVHSNAVHNGKDLRTKTRWDHDVLQVTTTQSGVTTLAGVTTVESYSLGADGTLSVSVVRPDRKPITLFFHRQ